MLIAFAQADLTKAPEFLTKVADDFDVDELQCWNIAVESVCQDLLEADPMSAVGWVEGLPQEVQGATMELMAKKWGRRIRLAFLNGCRRHFRPSFGIARSNLWWVRFLTTSRDRFSGPERSRRRSGEKR